MTMLNDAETRRGFRAIIQAILALCFTALVWYIAIQLRQNPEAMLSIAQIALGIIGLATMFYGMENVTRAFEFTFNKDGITARGGRMTELAKTARAQMDGCPDTPEEPPQ